MGHNSMRDGGTGHSVTGHNGMGDSAMGENAMGQAGMGDAGIGKVRHGPRAHEGARPPAWVRDAVDSIESSEQLDGVVAAYSGFGTGVERGPLGPTLRGDWLGHALHPLMTDIPIGCWQSASILDLIGGRRSRPAARRLVGLGVLTAIPTALTGLVELALVDDQRARRVAVVHAGANSAAIAMYLASYRRRRRDHHLSGALLALGGGAAATAAGYLGGHLAFDRGVGSGTRGESDALDEERFGVSPEDEIVVEEIVVEEIRLDDVSPDGAPPDPVHLGEVRGPGHSDLIGIDEAARELTVQVDQIHTMVRDGLLPTASTDPLRFHPADVQALRIQGA